MARRDGREGGREPRLIHLRRNKPVEVKLFDDRMCVNREGAVCSQEDRQPGSQHKGFTNS